MAGCTRRRRAACSRRPSCLVFDQPAGHVLQYSRRASESGEGGYDASLGRLRFQFSNRFNLGTARLAPTPSLLPASVRRVRVRPSVRFETRQSFKAHLSFEMVASDAECARSCRIEGSSFRHAGTLPRQIDIAPGQGLDSNPLADERTKKRMLTWRSRQIRSLLHG